MAVFAAIIIIIILLYAYIHLNTKSTQIDRMFPGPYRIPILGTLLPFNKFQESSDASNRWVETGSHQPFRLWLFNKPYIVISDYKTAKIILSQLKHIERADFYKAFIPVMGKNHFLGTKEVWAKYKKYTSSAFHHKSLNCYLDAIDRNGDILCSLLQKHVGKEAFDLTEYMSMFVLDNLVESLVGEPLHSQINPDVFSSEALRDLMQILRLRLVPIPGFDWILNMTPLGKRQEKDLRLLEEFSKKLLQRRKERINGQKNLNSNNQNDEASNQNTCILTELIMTNKFTDEEIIKEIQSGIFAGFESSSSILCFMIYLLAKHQDIQEKIYKEVTTVVEESDSWPNLHDLDRMVYTEQVLYETFRRYTPFPAIGRYIKEDLPINDHQFIPKNTNVIISLPGIHKDPATWPNPKKFDPDRFSPENREKRDPYAFLPFSAGPRKCAGYKFAIVQIKLATTKIVQRFKLTLNGRSQDEFRPARNKGLVLMSANGFNVKLQLRDEEKKP